jgi:hypothetical protein
MKVTGQHMISSLTPYQRHGFRVNYSVGTEEIYMVYST